MDMKSESSCTYNDYITEYSSTKDSELWRTGHLIGTELNMNLCMAKVPIILCDDISGEDLVHIPAIGPLQMEEMTMEPLFSVPADYQSFLESIESYRKGSIPVSLSNYGLKCLIFSLHGSIMCTKNIESKKEVCIYVPYRFFKKIVVDCQAQGVECETHESESKKLYHSISIYHSPEILQSSLIQKQLQILSNAHSRPVSESLTPVYKDGFDSYCPVDVTVLITLDSSKRIERYDESGNLIIHKSRRRIKIVPLSIGEPMGYGNDVASRTSPI